MTSTGQTMEVDLACIGEGETLRQAGHRMRELGVAALIVCGSDGQLRGILTRDMVVGSIAAGGDPKTVTVSESASYAPSAGPDRTWPGIGQRIGELTCAVRAAQRYGCYAA